MNSLNRKIKIYMGITTVGTIVDSQSYILRDIEDLYGDYIEFVYPDVCVRRMFHDYARNAVVEEFLASDCDVLWFLDSDITPSKFVMDLIALDWDEWKIAGATYPVFMIPGGSDVQEVVYTAYQINPKTGNMAPAPVPRDGKGFIDGLATGCLFIKREVFASLQKPYFEFKFDPDTRNMAEGEDLGFCRKANAAGYKFYTDFSYVCKHEKRVDLLDINNYAIQYSNRSVLEYDRRIKETIQPALDAQFAKGYQQGVAAFQAKLKEQNPERTSTLWLPK